LFFIDKKIKQDKMLIEMKQYQSNDKYFKIKRILKLKYVAKKNI